MEAHAKENMYVTDIPVIEHVPERTHSMHGNDAPIVGRKYTAIAWYLLSMVRVTTFTFPPLFYGCFDFIRLNIYKFWTTQRPQSQRHGIWPTGVWARPCALKTSTISLFTQISTDLVNGNIHCWKMTGVQHLQLGKIFGNIWCFCKKCFVKLY